ncbi:hypothetical protein SHJG_1732 [Streptomyces hygroscopicus subsp. jinggangensis 5008]|nr:hypothetical protein SHJG_1732 [Streptomyces hygroscopicus subsp. jinggangensis 5008]AGF61163.1 hypothetical protein SHJGH_1497 [Streptomyces hygroscopicus subsp. jinggangensis TL01]
MASANSRRIAPRAADKPISWNSSEELEELTDPPPRFAGPTRSRAVTGGPSTVMVTPRPFHQAGVRGSPRACRPRSPASGSRGQLKFEMNS